MDVVNGKIVSARTERSRSDNWSALKPSRGLLLQQEASLEPPPWPHGKQPGSSSLRSFGAAAAAFDQPAWTRKSSWGRLDPPHPMWSCPRPPLGFVSRAFLDEELDRCESLVSRAVTGRFATPRAVCKDAANATSTASVAPVVTTTPNDTPLSRYSLKRPHSEIDQVIGTWTTPLRYLLQKVMSVSDVGELGRIVLPKKDAEAQLPSIDTKGKQLEMKDYSFPQSWVFHYKWWVNNKSRMYVLENTGGFVKYHGLEANDSFFVYEDGHGNLVARGQKKLTRNPLSDAAVTNSVSGASDVESNSKSEKSPASTEHESCCINSTTPLIAVNWTHD